MLNVTIARPQALRSKCDVLAVPVFDGMAPGPGFTEIEEALGVPLRPVLESRRFSGKAGDVVALPTLGRLEAATVVLVGLGAQDQVDAEGLRRATAAAVRAGAGARTAVTTLAQALPADPAGAVRAVTEAAQLAAYRFARHRVASARRDAARRPALERLSLLAPEGLSAPAGRREVAAGEVRARATNLARDLSNEPANALHPADIAAAARAAVQGKSVTVRIRDEKALAREGFGGIIGVGQGAQAPPRLVELRYRPSGARGHVVLVGKGISFDSGGLSLKPAESMETMKTDMSGAAAVLGVMSALSDLSVRVAVTGYLACAENMPSGSATRPGDVVTMRGGKTVEVVNTDAEGRLVMADALALGATLKPDAMIDVATLTGACVVALGTKYAGVMGNDDDLIADLLAAGKAAGEPLWSLPLPEAYRKEIDSDYADLKNVGSRWGGALTAGLFLREFVDDRPWAHLDIAGPSRTDADDGYFSRGSTGFATRTLLSFLERRGQR